MNKYLADHVMCVARAWTSSNEAREVYDVLDELAGEHDFRALEYNPFSGSRYYRRAAPLPPDLSFLDFGSVKAEIEITWTLEYSVDAFRKCLEEQGHATAITLYREEYVPVGVHKNGEGSYVITGGISKQMTLQAKLEKMQRIAQITGLPEPIRVDCNWIFFDLCYVSMVTGKLSSIATVDSVEKAFEIAQKVLSLSDRPPSLISQGTSYREGETHYDVLRRSVNSNHRAVTFNGWWRYRDGFDPLCKPKKIPTEGIHFPMLELTQNRSTGEGVNLYMAYVHQRTGSYVELMTGFGIDHLQAWVDSFPNFKWEIWSGNPAERWDGDPAHINTPVLSPANLPNQFITRQDKYLRGFVNGNTLIIVLGEYHRASWVECLKYVGHKQDDRWNKQGYTVSERQMLAEVGMYESRFSEIEARFGKEWDQLHFWWPSQESTWPDCWGQYPKLVKLKSLPFKLRGRSVKVPLVIVNPLNCPLS